MPNARTLAAALALCCVETLFAQATVAAPPPTALAPLPEECVAEPRPTTELAHLLVGAAAFTPTATPILEGDFAPVGAVTAMTATRHGYLACVNGDDVARACALLSDAAVLRLAAVAMAATPAATPVLGATVDLAEIVLTDGAWLIDDVAGTARLSLP